NIIVCDGKFTVMVLPETEQIMFDSADRIEGFWSPVSVLTDGRLKEIFAVGQTDETAGSITYRLTPISPDERFEYLELTILKSGDIGAFELAVIDASGNQNRLSFSSLRNTETRTGIEIPEIPSAYDITDFQGHPRNPGVLKRRVTENEN
nr:outer membrane lipoprotein carrier protein LolA [bacterium]